MEEINFEAQWTAQNCQLQYRLADIVNSPFHSLCNKVHLCFIRILEWCGEIIGHPVHQYAKSKVVGGTKDTREQVDLMNQQWRSKWEGTPTSDNALIRGAYEPVIIKAHTPNGDTIEGTFYRSRRSANPDLPTILCPNPNLGGLSRSEGWDWLLKKGAKSPLPFNVIVFDYASAAAQGGALHSPKDLTLNADTFYQFAQKQGVSESNLHFFGFCSGSNVLSTLAVIHPNSGRFVSLNATYNLSELIYRSPHCYEEMLKQKIPLASFMRTLTYVIFKLTRWTLDTTQEFNAISQRTLFLNHHEDRLVNRELYASGVVKDANAVVLRTKPNVRIQDPEYVTHWLPVSLTEDETGLSGSKRIVNFILGRQVFQRHQGDHRSTYVIPTHKRGLQDIQRIRPAG